MKMNFYKSNVDGSAHYYATNYYNSQERFVVKKNDFGNWQAYRKNAAGEYVRYGVRSYKTANEAKWQLDSELMEHELAATRDKVRQLTIERDAARDAQKLPDTKMNNNEPTDWGKWRQINDEADRRFCELLEWATRNKLIEPYEDQYDNYAFAVGHFMSTAAFKYYGDPMVLAAAYGLEDANWHTEAGVFFEMYYRMKLRDAYPNAKVNSIPVFEPLPAEVAEAEAKKKAAEEAEKKAAE